MSKLITSSSHGPGQTCIAFSKDGSRAFTGGQDCIVRIWKVEEGAEQEPAAAADADGAVTSVAVTDDFWLSSSEDCEVRRYFKDTSEFDAPVTAAIAVPVRSVAIDPKGKRVAVASDELFVKVIDMEDIMNVDRLEGYSRGVRRVSWHPTENLLTTSGADGKIIVWNMSESQPKIEKTIDGLISAVIDPELPEFAHDCTVLWHTSGQYFFVGTRSQEIVTVSRADWSKSATFSDKNVGGAVTALALSPNGAYLASASQSKVHIWSTQTRRLITSRSGTIGSTITQIAFSPRQNLIAWTDSDGAFTRWPKPLDESLPDPVRVTAQTSGLATIPMKPRTGLNLFGDDVGEPATNDFQTDVADVDLDEAMADVDDDWIVDDLGIGGIRDEPEKGRLAGGLVKEMVSIVKAQPPFQPGSTPMVNKKRYLAYNMIGVIDVTDQDTHHIVNVDFFDRSSRKGYHFTDHYKYDLGYLGERGAVFACPPENDHSAQVLFKPYSTWTAQKEWVYPLRKETRVLGICAGALGLPSKNSDGELQGFGNVVIATSESDLTFLSGTGRERRIMPLGGDFVSMVASAEWIFVVHRAGSTTIDGSQNLSYSIINFEDFSVRQRDVLPISKGHTLKWIGITDQGAPAMYDSTGQVHILTKYRIPHHASWARVMDTNLLERRQGKDESYWPVGITGSTFMCLILKGRQEHPGFPRPLIQELPMQLPFRREEPKEEKMERELLIVQNALDALDDELTTDEIVGKEVAIDKELMTLIQVACKNDNIARAIELTKLIHGVHFFEKVMRIADFYHLVGFREKVEIIKAEREESEDRLIIARNKRRRWMKPDAPLREVMHANGASSSRLDPLGDIRPPPAIERPGMARVTVPIIQNSRYSSVPPSSQTPAKSSWGEASLTESPTSQDGKRKRMEFEDSINTADPLSMPPPKQKANPFARKADATRNPFARKPENKTIQKSESFFDKVDAAESDTSKLKRPFAKGKEKEMEKDKKEGGPRQATLFGMMGKSVPSKKPKPKKTDVVADENEVLESPVADVDMADMFVSEANTLVETQQETQEDSQETQEDSQETQEDSLMDDSLPGGEETEPADETSVDSSQE